MIEIGNYRINRFDDKNIIIESKKMRTEGDKAGSYIISTCGYFPSLSVALSWLFDKLSSDALLEAKSLNILAVRIEEIRDEIIQAVKDLNIKKESQ